MTRVPPPDGARVHRGGGGRSGQPDAHFVQSALTLSKLSAHHCWSM
ncbi:hypothetical protein ACFSTC_38740 [Nonomuraea ferruginea]